MCSSDLKEVFSSTKFDVKVLQKRMQELAFLNKGLSINLYDRTGKKEKGILLSGKYQT